jgi:hypothetical protein
MNINEFYNNKIQLLIFIIKEDDYLIRYVKKNVVDINNRQFFYSEIINTEDISIIICS